MQVPATRLAKQGVSASIFELQTSGFLSHARLLAASRESSRRRFYCESEGFSLLPGGGNLVMMAISRWLA